MIYPVVLYLKIQSAGQSLLFSSLAELPASSSIGTGFTATPPSLEKRAGSNLSKDARHSWAQGTESSSTKLGRVLMHGCMTSYLAGQEWTHSVTLSPVHQKQSLLNKGRAGPQEYIPLLLPHEGVRRSPLNVDHSKNERRQKGSGPHSQQVWGAPVLPQKKNARKRKSQSTDSSLGNFWGNSACLQSTLMTIRGIPQCVISPSLQISFMWTSCEHFYCTLFHLLEPRASHTPGTTPLNYIPVSSLAFIDNAQSCYQFIPLTTPITTLIVIF